ncbi:beta-ketoacyl-[acyl-carrier-protein] synthase family protein [Streptomyces sp. F001]|uniref:beta-ketoacyl-[acyl-carrier-protein] synthase family protein n=1 Tax=Streptomyces sp. F001 TaxID=1510026 RepID=UPI00101E5D95|nr:beta-ketoacyl-[acyl-carrier-protein] synthase family protein [Streptomyces sp. F001]RZB16024.1 beta-ketoacyl-[acyl-carrier-protein] synthase family protein [Streptomyces sp. F001]
MSDWGAVVTGVGVVAPGAVGRAAYWDLLTAGRTATRGITLFDAAGFQSRIAAEVDFDPAAAGLTPHEVERMDRSAQFAVVAAREALADAGLEPGQTDPERVGVSIGSAVGCTTRLEDEYVMVSDSGKNWEVTPEFATDHLYRALIPSTLAVEVAWTAGAEGPTTVVSTGCTSGLDAVGHGVQLISEGAADVVIAGATDAPISPITVACFDAIGATSRNNEDAAHSSRPFDRDRDGFVLGEGSAVLVLESREHAARRGAHGYAEIIGFAQRSNAYHMTGLKPDGLDMAEAIEIAMRRAGITPDMISYVNAHGSGTAQNDRHETAAVKKALGEAAHRVPVSSIKSMIGHSLGAIGALEVAACALAIETDTVPPTANLQHQDPALDLDYVPLAARKNVNDIVLSVGSGFGGFQSAMLLARPGLASRK